jgi:hypothetical protein
MSERKTRMRRILETLNPVRVLAVYAIAGVILAGLWLANSGLGGTMVQALQTEVHGISFSKGCESPTTVGAPYTCTFLAQNLPSVDTALDTLTFNGISDTVNANPVPIPSGNILSSLTVASYGGGASCEDGAAVAVPVGGTGAVLCTLPSNSSVQFQPFSFYTPMRTTRAH